MRDDDLAGMSREMREMVTRERDRWSERVAESRKRFAVQDLVGMTVTQARVAVEAVGGEFVTNQQPVAAKLDPNRVVARIQDGRVTGTEIW